MDWTIAVGRLPQLEKVHATTMPYRKSAGTQKNSLISMPMSCGQAEISMSAEMLESLRIGLTAPQIW